MATGQVLLRPTTGAEDLIVGAPVANRHRPELDGVIGFFLNLLPLRLRPRPDRSFRDLLAKARETAVGAFAHQKVPFERIVDELEFDRDLSRSGVVQCWYTLTRRPRELGGLGWDETMYWRL
jgi:non-ribosomal peptide synthetase component F